MFSYNNFVVRKRSVLSCQVFIFNSSYENSPKLTLINEVKMTKGRNHMPKYTHPRSRFKLTILMKPVHSIISICPWEKMCNSKK